MRKLIHSNFELDLAPFKLSDIEENNWFSDSFFTKFSFPFEIDLTEDLDQAIDFISLYNSNPQTYFEVLYVHNNSIEEAIFEIESHQYKLSATLHFGMEQLPSWDKKLSELSLQKFDLPTGTTIYDHANSIIGQTWPAVNYNFPQVHIDKYDLSEYPWAFFERIINNRVGGQFLTNRYNLTSGYEENRNIMQPLPYWLYIIQRGMIDAGYILTGEILQDERLKTACLYGDVEYFRRNQLVQHDFENGERANVLKTSFTTSEAIDSDFSKKYYYQKTILEGIGKYKIYGLFAGGSLPSEQAYCQIKHNGTIVFHQLINDPLHWSPAGGGQWMSELYPFEIYVDTITYADTLEFELLTKMGPIIVEFYQNVLWYDITPAYFEQDVPIISIINEDKVDLTRAVPDMTFGDFIKVVKNWFNYDLTVSGIHAIMNPVNSQINYDSALDMRFSEVKYPKRNFYQGSSFLLKFQDIESKDYTYLPVFQDWQNILTENYTTNEKTTTIEVIALPLPMLTRSTVKTAHAFESSESKPYLVSYNGLVDGNNLAQPNEVYLMPAVHLRDWKNWFTFRINAQSFTWQFKAWEESIIELKAKTKVFAFNKYHIIKTINKTEVKPQLFEIEIITESLE